MFLNVTTLNVLKIIKKLKLFFKLKFVKSIIRGYLGGDLVIKEKVSDFITSQEWLIIHLGGKLIIKEVNNQRDNYQKI